jgi:hypothetical protein
MVPVAVVGAATLYPVPAATVRMTVSLASTVLSAVGSTVTVAVELPAANVTVPVGGVKVAAPVWV